MSTRHKCRIFIFLFKSHCKPAMKNIIRNRLRSFTATVNPDFILNKLAFLKSCFQINKFSGREIPVTFVDKDKTSWKNRLPRQAGEESLSKAVSKNITSILEDLLKDYDKTERPSFKDGVRM